METSFYSAQMSNVTIRSIPQENKKDFPKKSAICLQFNGQPRYHEAFANHNNADRRNGTHQAQNQRLVGQWDLIIKIASVRKNKSGEVLTLMRLKTYRVTLCSEAATAVLQNQLMVPYWRLW